ncbi:MAG: class I SAM-dependent methyltransferase family protein [Nanoarchaeota archaeon]|nr:class I SAM-dependent methyltransferase family protein [Nanoarchaeota archaeon]MBU1004381.1 class I SAM-dependent methyltransferase family protein [Nanoarchaeota archaeon]MBU1946732.1 class I SAM-dependent methyltransferase family protein [Nanoarchaeota archaeon]
MPTLKDSLRGKLNDNEIKLVPSSFDMVGDLAIFSDFPKELIKKEKMIGEALLELNRNIKVVLKKTRKYSGEFRTPKLKIIAGEKRKETELKENNIRLRLNPEKVYFSIRLATERKRVIELVSGGEEVLVMFSGVGPYSIGIAKNKKPKEVYSVEINPSAFKYQKENILINKVDVKLFKGDVKNVVPKLKKKFDRILMPLPRGAESFLGVALKAAKKNSIVHFYDFLHEDEFKKAEEKIAKACKKAGRKFKIIGMVKCGQFGPGIFRICFDFRVI